MNTDADQSAEVGERHQHSGARHQYQRRLPGVRKRVVRHVEPAHESPATTGSSAAAREYAEDVGDFRSALSRALVEDSDRHGADVVGSVGGDSGPEVGSAAGRRDEPVRRDQPDADQSAGHYRQNGPQHRTR